MVQQVIAVMGSICAGKDSLKDYLIKKYNYHAIKLGNILRGEAREAGIKINRDSLYKLSKKLKRKYPNFLIKRAIEEAEKNKWKKVVFGDLREEAEVRYLKKKFGKKLKIIRVDASLEVRFKRIKSRGRKSDPKTLTEFKKIDAREYKRFHLSKLFKHADFTIVNNNGYAKLYMDADKIIKRINKK